MCVDDRTASQISPVNLEINGSRSLEVWARARTCLMRLNCTGLDLTHLGSVAIVPKTGFRPGELTNPTKFLKEFDWDLIISK